jgi:hypothetical protein
VPTRAWSGSATALLFALVGAWPACAQISISADATAATAHYDGFLRSGVLLFTPMVRLERPLVTAAARSTFSLFESGRGSIDALVTGSMFTPGFRSFRGEVSGVGGLTRYRRTTTGYGGGGARLHMIGPGIGGWIGAGITSVTGGTAVLDGTRIEAGWWMRVGTFTLSAAGSGSNVEGLGYFDSVVSTRWSRGWIELAANGSGRVIEDETSALLAGDLAVTFWLSRSLAVVFGHGSYLSDPAQLASGGRYTALTMRIASRPPALRDALARSIGYQAPSVARPVVAAFESRRDRSGLVRFRIRTSDATTVDLMGDFTDWAPVGDYLGRMVSSAGTQTLGSSRWRTEIV